ncbi:type VI lipase adapter Tla3 domain-containing protein [Achromobacter spanius]|uniref:type VI lipase adapter Tla3 domain-containing protein n=1 Tax=Achromobacter spanius TaxID=217203 RepID=UPI003209336D
MNPISLLAASLLLRWWAVAPEAPPLPEPETEPLAAMACPLPSAQALPAAAVSPTTPSASKGAPMLQPRLETLDIVRVGLSLDVYRQGQAWAQLRKQSADQPNALFVGSALPMDPRDYPVSGSRQDLAWVQRKSNALELALRSFPERWPLPTVVVVRDYNPRMERPRVLPKDMEVALRIMATSERGDAGLHWHEMRQLDNGVICNTDPEAVIESIFQLFERNPDMPALLVYALDSFNLRAALSSEDLPLNDIAPPGERTPETPTDAVVALVVARPERLDWLREFAKYTKAKPGSIDPAFIGWERSPRRAFKPTTFFPKPITQRGFEQWDSLKVLARLHRPVTVSLHAKDGADVMLKGAGRDQAIASGWDQAITALDSTPTRVFFDTGKLSGGIVQLAPALLRVQHPLDLLDSTQSYDLSQRLGDTGAASPFVGLALATMASHLNADSSLVAPLRRADRATFIGISPPAPGVKPAYDPFGVSLRPQHTAVTDEPSPEFKAWLGQRHIDHQREQDRRAPRYRDPVVVAREQRMLDDFIAGLSGADTLGPKNN